MAKGIHLKHAGTTNKNGEVVTAGGRVMAISSFGEKMTDALELSYANVNKICFEGINYRKDIGKDLLKYQD